MRKSFFRAFACLTAIQCYFIYPLFFRGRSGAWDGSAHEAIAFTYSEHIFFDTFGWSYLYFGGMAFPNFYPPVFYWIVASLSRLVPFELAFKLLIFLPTLTLPSLLWIFIFNLTGKDRLSAWAGSIGSLFLLLDSRFIFALPAGLDFFSTFQIGLYTQPLGFAFFLIWYMCYQRASEGKWYLLLSGVFLALTVLTNFFVGIVAVLFALVLMLESLCLWRRETESIENITSDASRRSAFRNNRNEIVTHILAAFLALLLTSFWLVPMLSQYSFFVTRPYIVEANQLLPPAWGGWFVLSACGFYVWYSNPTRPFRPYAIGCLVLALLSAFSAFFAPAWFPLQSPRFLAILNFLLVVPVGVALSFGFRRFSKILGEIGSLDEQLTFGKVKYTAGVSLLVLILFTFSSPGTRMGEGFAFLSDGEKQEIEQLLTFARDHKDGRYVVEVVNPVKTNAHADAAFNARAISAYLGPNGNEVLSAVFHEASPHSLFTLPVINSLSDYPDSFGISSILSDDIDFYAQPVDKHIARARFLGTKYLVVRSPETKERLSKSSEIKRRTEFGFWTVFELKTEENANPTAQALHNLPALVVSDLNLKARYRDDISYIRFVEEQFADAWFDVLLSRSPEMRLDRLHGWEKFGAVVVESYDYDDETRAYEKLREISQQRRLILLSQADPLFERIRDNHSEFPNLTIVERPPPTEDAEMLKSNTPTYHYDGSTVRRMWGEIRRALEQSKIPTGAGGSRVVGEKLPNLVKVDLSADSHVPVLIANTYHPRWNRADGSEIYPTTPFYQLTFAKEPFEVAYGRNTLDRAALWISATTLLFLIGLSLFAILKGRFLCVENRGVKLVKSCSPKSRQKLAGRK